MAIGKALNKGSYYASEGGGDIAMPPLDQAPPISQSAPDPWEAQKMQQQQAHNQNPFGQVPDELPQEVRQEMDSFQDNQDQNDAQDQQSTRDVLSHVDHNQPKEDHKNFRALKEAKAQVERERDAMLSQMLAMQQQMQLIQKQQPQQQEQPIEDTDFDIDPEALVEGKHVKKVAAKLKAMEQQMRKYQQVSEGNAVEARIRAQYPDFEKVVSKREC